MKQQETDTQLNTCFRAIIGLAVVVLLSACATETVDDSRAETAASVNVQLGVSYMEQGELERALQRLNKALDFDPDSVDAHLAIAHLYSNLDQREKAEHHYRRAIAIAPDQASVLNNFATFLCSRKSFDEAVDMFVRAATSPFYDTPQAAWSNAGICALQAGDVHDAEQYLRRAIEQDPELPAALITLAEIYHEQAQDFRARAFAERYAAVGRITPDFLMLGYRIEERLGNSQGQSNYRERLLTEFPDSRQARRLIGGESEE